MATPKKESTDKYANQLIVTVTESAANTLTFAQAPQITTLLEKKAYIINRIQYLFDVGLVAAVNDVMYFGLSLANTFVTADLAVPQIIDFNAIQAMGTAVEIHRREYVTDFSTLPGGGLLIPTRPLFLWAEGANLASAMTVVARIYFTIADLTPEDYWDLVESLQAYT